MQPRDGHFIYGAHPKANSDGYVNGGVVRESRVGHDAHAKKRGADFEGRGAARYVGGDVVRDDISRAGDIGAADAHAAVERAASTLEHQEVVDIINVRLRV